MAKDGKSFQELPSEIFNLDGPSGNLLRILKNNLCFAMGDDLRYLEVGVEKGVGVTSSLYGMKPLYSVGVDPYGNFEEVSEEFKGGETMHQFEGQNEICETAKKNFKDFDIQIDLKIRNCWNMEDEDFDQKFNFYLYDGPHDEDSQRWGLEKYYDRVDDEFVFCVDDWNVAHIREGTYKAIANMGLKIILEENFFTHKDTPQALGGCGNRNTWWNGYVVFVLRK